MTILLAALGALLLVPVSQAFATTNTKINISGSGSGEVVSTGSGEFDELEANPPVACKYNGASTSGVCQTESLETEEESGFYDIALDAKPAPGSAFLTWTVQKGEGHQKGFSQGSCPFLVSGAPNGECFANSENEGEELEMTAVFVKFGPKLTLNIEEGSGTVVSNPSGLECTGTAPHSCSTELIEAGKTVTLTASPATGFAFKSWKKCDSVNGRQCTVTLSAAREVGAKFVPVQRLTTKVEGQGSVKSKPGGISCLPTCTSMTAEFAQGSTVELLQTPAKHFKFTGWSGACSGEGACSVTMSAAKEVTATFAELPKFTVELLKVGGGTALIKTKPTGINCGFTCSKELATFYRGEEVEVSWKLNKGTTSLEWFELGGSAHGTCTGKHEAVEGTCKVTSDGILDAILK